MESRLRPVQLATSIACRETGRAILLIALIRCLWG